MMRSSTLESQLQSALKYINDTCVMGSSNKISDLNKTNHWCESILENRLQHGEFIKETNSQGGKVWRYQVNESISSLSISKHFIHLDPINDPVFNLTENKKLILFEALFAQKTRAGNCGNKSALLTKHLWENCKDIHKLEYVNMMNYDHSFIIINREGLLEKPSTWGNAFILDGWFKNGILYPASDYLQQIKMICQYAKEQANLIYKKCGKTWSYKKTSNDEYDLICFEVILPQIEAYPCYSNQPLEYFYDVDIETSDTFNNQIHYQFCLEKLKMFSQIKLVSLADTKASEKLIIWMNTYAEALNLFTSTALKASHEQFCQLLIVKIEALARTLAFHEPGLVLLAVKEIIESMLDFLNQEMKSFSYHFLLGKRDPIQVLNSEKGKYSFVRYVGNIVKDILENEECIETIKKHCKLDIKEKTNHLQLKKLNGMLEKKKNVKKN